MRSFSVLAQLRTCTTHNHRSWNVPILPSIQSVQDEKCPFHKNCYRIAKTCKNVHMHVQHTRKTCRGVANCWFVSSWPKDSKTNHLNLSELVCLNSEDDWTNPQDNSIKILWPIQTQQGNQYRQNYVTVTYVLWEQMNRRTVDLGFIQSRAEVTAVFANVDSTHGLRQFRQRFGNKKKDKRKG